MRKSWLILPVLAALSLVVGLWPTVPYRTVDFLQIGNETSEAAHGIAGWGPIEPDTHGGGWGGLAIDTDPYTDQKTRVLWNKTDTDMDFFEERSAYFNMTITKKCDPAVCNRQWLRADRMGMRYLDGQAVDDFIVLWKNPNGNWELIGVIVTNHADTSEIWKVANLNLVGKIPTQYRAGGGKLLEFRFVATGNQWALFDPYGQVAIDYIWLEQP